MMAATLAYLPVLREEFVSDDIDNQRELPSSVHGLADIFQTKALTKGWIFRPVSHLSTFADEWLNNLVYGIPGAQESERLDPRRAHLPHASSLLIHVLATGAVVVFSALFLRGRAGAQGGALAAGLLFALHPVHTENVAWIAARADSLYTLLLLVSLILALIARERGERKLLPISAFLFLAALFSKEFAVTGLLLLPLCIWAVPKPDEAERPLSPVLLMTIFSGAVLAYFGLRLFAGASLLARYPRDVVVPIQVLQAAGFYVRKIIIPWPLTPMVAILPGRLATAIALTAAVAAGFAALRRGERIYIFCLAWFAVACSPAVAVALRFYTFNPAAERYLYLPGAGFALAGGALAAAASVSGYRRIVVGGMGVALAVCAWTIWTTVDGPWRNDRAFTLALIRQSASSLHPQPWVVAAGYFAREGNFEEAEHAYRSALSPGMLPDALIQAEAANGLGDLARRRMDDATRRSDLLAALAAVQEAEANYEQATKLNPAGWYYRKNLALMRLQHVLFQETLAGIVESDLLEKAGRDIAEILQLSPDNPELIHLQGLYKELGGTRKF
jgi:tetratricopeptide (TPR) repeat protein